MRKKKAPEILTDSYSIQVKLGAELYTSFGDTMLSALESMESPQKFTQKAIVTVSRGKKKAERVLLPVRMKRFFYKIAREQMAKQMETWIK